MNSEFWRLVVLAQSDPDAYRLEMDMRRFCQIVSSTNLDWCEKALREYFGFTPEETEEAINLIVAKSLK
jgi:Holliday junction resolvasome RuvABC ATP-dependent DNA helicase subunit